MAIIKLQQKTELFTDKEKTTLASLTSFDERRRLCRRQKMVIDFFYVKSQSDFQGKFQGRF